jgi:pyruvate ferredoxin oxidoreductase gamma subunit
MFQVRIHGRGGQGVVTAAEMLSVAAFTEGKHAQAFPSFGSERTGAPVVAFCRIDDRPIRLREPIVNPDCVIVQDPTLLRQIDCVSDLGPDGYLLVNSAKPVHELGLDAVAARLRPERLVTVAATEIARETVGRPLPNAVLLGGFAALTGVVSILSIAEAIRATFSGRVAAGNVAGAERAHAQVRGELAPEVVHAQAG